LSATQRIRIVNLRRTARAEAVPILIGGFVGVYRWHAKRTLREVPRVRGARRGATLVGVAMLDRLLPEVGFVAYLAVTATERGQGIGGLLIDDAIELFRKGGVEIVYASSEAGNTASFGMLRSRGFQVTERKERGFRDGGLGAWGLRSRMRIVSGEVLFGLRLQPTPRGRSRPTRISRTT
jgi:ribosomal protein S18 acetylase RimI-like enzyme